MSFGLGKTANFAIKGLRRATLKKKGLKGWYGKSYKGRHRAYTKRTRYLYAGRTFSKRTYVNTYAYANRQAMQFGLD